MFNITDVKIENAFEPLEAGWYGGHISTLEWKESAKGARYINAQMKSPEISHLLILKKLYLHQGAQKIS